MDRPLPDRDSRRGPPPPRRSRPPAYPRDNPRKQPRREDRQDLDNDWVHDRYDDEPEPRDNYTSKPRSRRDDRDYDEYDRKSPDRDRARDRDRDRDRDSHRDSRRDRDRERDSDRDRDRPGPPPAKIRVDNLHYDLNSDDLYDLFTRIAPVKDVKLQYDRAGRSEGIAFVTYDFIADARTAVKEFDGANAKGQPIRLTILPLPPKGSAGARGGTGNPFDRVENPRSLFDRIDNSSNTRGRRRSESPMDEDREYSRNNSARRGPRGARGDRRSDTSKPPPDGIDRYIPGSGRGRGGRAGGGGERRERPPRGDGPPRSGARPKKTADELDAEMDDYWKGSNNNDAAPVANNSAGADDDIDMIE